MVHPSAWSWIPRYIRAFRACCDTLVLGPASPDPLGCPEPDVVCDFGDTPDLYAVLPEGWVPDLVVGIAGIGGEALYPAVAELSCPTAYFTIDTWQCISDYHHARNYDFVFAAQSEFVPLLEATGAARVSWLPLACDPREHGPVEVPKTHDVSFPGSYQHPVHNERKRLLRSLQDHYAVLVEEKVYGAAANAVFCSGRMIFNHCAVQEVNMRVFEAMATGSPLLCNEDASYNGLLDLFEDGEHLVLYSDERDLHKQVQRLLGDDRERVRIGKTGMEYVRSAHTYEHRVNTFLQTVMGAVPALTKEGLKPAWTGTPLVDCVPFAAGRVVDFSGALGAWRELLALRGVTQLTGMKDAGAGYDECVDRESLGVEAAEVVVLVDEDDIERAIKHGGYYLVPGGSLVVQVNTATWLSLELEVNLDELQNWLSPQGFVYRRLLGMPDGEGYLLVLRKRTRSVRDVVTQVYDRLQLTGIDAHSVVDRIPATW